MHLHLFKFDKKMSCAACSTSALFSIALIFLAGCQTPVLKAIPEGYSLRYGEVVYVENDGRCSPGEVIMITGGESDRKILRKYACVKRPE